MDQPLLDSIDLEILMHKDAHFGGSFSTMIEYYRKEGIGAQEDFDIRRIQDLAALDTDGHLSAEMLPESAKNDVIFSKELYKKFKDCYEEDDALPKALADLILSESYDPSEEIKALSFHQKRAVKPLVEILLQDRFYNPLNPGYGRGPVNAALTLKDIGNTDAIPYLFNALGKSFSIDEILINTLASFGKDTIDFLEDRIQGKPYTNDNYLSAMALASFPINDETAKLALSLLTRKETFDHPSYTSYLVCICEGLEAESDRKQFIEIAKSKNLTSSIAKEMALIISFWQNNTC